MAEEVNYKNIFCDYKQLVEQGLLLWERENMY